MPLTVLFLCLKPTRLDGLDKTHVHWHIFDEVSYKRVLTDSDADPSIGAAGNVTNSQIFANLQKFA